MKLTKIAVISDDKDMRESIDSYFGQRSDVKIVLNTDDGYDAIRRLEETGAQIVITHVFMQNVNGLDLMRHFAGKQYNPKFIIVSDLKSEVFLFKCMSDGASGYLLKPLNLKQLDDKIADIRNGFATTEKQKSVTVRDFVRSIDERLATIFVSIGIPPHIKGYQFLRDGVKCVVDEPSLINSITRGLYPEIAKKYDTTPSKVERAIRHAIEVAWNRGKIENINSLFGVKIYSANEKPTNGEFIALLADKMLLEGAG